MRSVRTVGAARALHFIGVKEHNVSLSLEMVILNVLLGSWALANNSHSVSRDVYKGTPSEKKNVQANFSPLDF